MTKNLPFDALPPDAARRLLLSAALGLSGAFGVALGATAPARAEPQPVKALPFHVAMPAMFLNQGVWEGVYRKTDPGLHLLDSYNFRIAVALREDGGPAYRQETTYRWADGHSKESELLADYRDGAVTWSNPSSTGRVIQIAPQVLWMEMHFTADPTLDVMEINRIAPDGSARSRVSILSRKGKTETLYIADEHRAS